MVGLCQQCRGERSGRCREVTARTAMRGFPTVSHPFESLAMNAGSVPFVAPCRRPMGQLTGPTRAPRPAVRPAIAAEEAVMPTPRTSITRNPDTRGAKSRTGGATRRRRVGSRVGIVTAATPLGYWWLAAAPATSWAWSHRRRRDNRLSLATHRGAGGPQFRETPAAPHQLRDQHPLVPPVPCHRRVGAGSRNSASLIVTSAGHRERHLPQTPRTRTVGVPPRGIGSERGSPWDQPRTDST